MFTCPTRIFSTPTRSAVRRHALGLMALSLVACGGSPAAPDVVLPDPAVSSQPDAASGAPAPAPGATGVVAAPGAGFADWLPPRSTLTAVLGAVRKDLSAQAVRADEGRFAALRAAADTAVLRVQSSESAVGTPAPDGVVALTLDLAPAGGALAFGGGGRVRTPDGRERSLFALADPTPLSRGITLGAWGVQDGMGAVRLALVPADDTAQVRLCWDIRIDAIERHFCTTHGEEGGVDAADFADPRTGVRYLSRTDSGAPLQMLRCLSESSAAVRYSSFRFEQGALFREGVEVARPGDGNTTVQPREDGSEEVAHAGSLTWLQYVHRDGQLAWFEQNVYRQGRERCQPF